MFRAGQKVVYIGNNFDSYGRDVLVRQNIVYTVASTFIYYDQEAIHLNEFPGWPYGWMARLFRPVVEKKNETDISVFQKLLNTQKVEEPA